MTSSYYIGVDVGTGSVRANLVKADRTVIASSIYEILTFRDPDDSRILEQSTTNIWSAISEAISSIRLKSGIPPSAVKGLGFDGTCSLVVIDVNGDPVVVTTGDHLGQLGPRDVILWADHRAEEEAQIINDAILTGKHHSGRVMSVRLLSSFAPLAKVLSSVYQLTARDGLAQDPLAQETHGPCSLRPLSIL
jgi:ribulose kinase